MRSWFILILAFGIGGAFLDRVGGPATGQEDSFNKAVSAQERRWGIDDLSSQSSSASDSSPSATDGAVELTRDPNGHFYADVKINGSTVHMLVDTGASAIALSREDARSAGIATSIGMPNVIGEGADGAVHGEVVQLDRVELGHRTAEGLEAVVLNSGAQSLLGQSFLRNFASVEIHGDKMVLR
jgi:aspartyl protease family protein